MSVWGLVPARGASKSIPLKNLLPLAGRPLLDYVVRAGQASGVLSRLLCSTDNERIAHRAYGLGIDVDVRPAALATDDAKVDDVARDLLMRARAEGQSLPESIVLLQPTSPFVQPRQIRDLVAAFCDRSMARSVHNVYPAPHNLHSWNQRRMADDGAVEFPFDAERKRARNKQEKPKLYVFGNLIAAQTEALLAGDGFYAKPTFAVPIEAPFAFDLDQPADIVMAEALIATGLICLDHLSPSTEN
jgi:CMP-N,N'-diacetyllegionaminic acid synthase